MLDSNLSDLLGTDDQLRSELRRAVEAGDVDALVTHIQVDENLDIPDPEAGRRLIHAMMGAGVRAVPTFGVVLDVSRLGSARLADERTSAMIEAYRQGNPKQSEDALIAATALHEDAILVTLEKGRGRFRRAFPGLTVWSADELRDHLSSQSDPAWILASNIVASGSIVTREFKGPGRVNASARLAMGSVEPLELVVTGGIFGGLERSRGGSTSFTQSLARIDRSTVALNITVARTDPGVEPVREFRWELKRVSSSGD